MTWFRLAGSDLWHCHKGVEWQGFCQTHCDKIVLLEDIVEDRDTVEVNPSRACPHCVAALEVAA